MALADFVVVEIVGRGDFHATGAEFRIAVIVGDDRDAAANQRQLDKFADQSFVAFVVRVNRHGGVAEHGFRTRGRDDQVIVAFSGFGAVGQRVFQVPQETFFSSWFSTSRSEIAVCSLVSQLTRRLPR